MQSNIKKLITLICLSFTLTISTPVTTDAQCPMCRMSAESNLKNGGEAGKGLNNGILYMLATPYLLIGGIAYVWYRNRRKEEDELDDLIED
ncbi:MAG TPA: hypothetical protein VJ953_06375 [Saprospiraceae bacterium]|nr:hypothetical protein [Saprospiraceae bacterium]